MQTSHYFSLETITRLAVASLIPQLGDGFAFVEGHLEVPAADDWGSAEFARHSQLIFRERQEPRLARQRDPRDTSYRDPAPPEEISGFYTGKLAPAKLVFSRAGEPMTIGAMTIESILEIAAHYVGLDYVGILQLVARSRYGARAGVSLHLVQLPGRGVGPIVTIIIGDPAEGLVRSQIRIDYDGNDSSQTAITDALVAICNQSDLQRFEPEPAQRVA